jgi:RimJ/RimL family protein N-acetyltransferase
MIALRDVREEDLPLFFEHMQDPAAVRMAAFTPKDPADRAAFAAHWTKLRANATVVAKTILCDGRVAGSILKFEQDGTPEVTYWIAREYWGRGVATQALAAFLPYVRARPLYGRAAKDNVGSIRVLEKCGFTLVREEKGFANARGTEIEEVVLELR